MKKLGAALALVAVLGANSLPAMADDDNLEKVTQGSLIVTRVGGVGAGLVIGTPVSVIRHTYKNYIDFTEKSADKVGDGVGGKDCGPLCLVCSLVTLPASVVVGSLQGLYYGGKNGVVTGFNQPFHPDSFSMGELEGE